MLLEWITPGIVVALMLFIWRDLKHDMRDVRQDLRALAARFDRHLEGHP